MTTLLYATLTLLIITLLLICTVCMMEIEERIDRTGHGRRKPEVAPEPPMPKRGVTYEHSGPTKKEEEFYLGGDEESKK